jgi:hypothetical protein
MNKHTKHGGWTKINGCWNGNNEFKQVKSGYSNENKEQMHISLKTYAAVVAENKYCITVVSKKSVHRTVPQD